MQFYHATTAEGWAAIQREGCLYGVREFGRRVTYLAVDVKDASCWAGILLSVEYTPDPEYDNYIQNCWQFRVYREIPINNVQLMGVNNDNHRLAGKSQ